VWKILNFRVDFVAGNSKKFAKNWVCKEKLVEA
jgi:hypothetical protein